VRPKPMSAKNGFSVERSSAWLESLDSFIRSGTNRHIEYFHPNWKELRKVLEGEPIGYLVAQNTLVEIMLQRFGPAFLKRAGVAMWIPLADAVEQNVRKTFASLNIPIRANYSAEEAGLIGASVKKIRAIITSRPVTSSSRWMEPRHRVRRTTSGPGAGDAPAFLCDTFIRYDIGDLASLAARCACGHDGPTLSNVFGRSKNSSNKPTAIVSLLCAGPELHNIAKFDEYRIRQVDVTTSLSRLAAARPCHRTKLRAWRG